MLVCHMYAMLNVEVMIERATFRSDSYACNMLTSLVLSCPVPCAMWHCSKYFETTGQRYRRLKVLEIGLGCNMGYGPGKWQSNSSLSNRGLLP